MSSPNLIFVANVCVLPCTNSRQWSGLFGFFFIIGRIPKCFKFLRPLYIYILPESVSLVIVGRLAQFILFKSLNLKIQIKGAARIIYCTVMPQMLRTKQEL